MWFYVQCNKRKTDFWVVYQYQTKASPIFEDYEDAITWAYANITGAYDCAPLGD